MTTSRPSQPLKLWMKIVLRISAVLNIAIGVSWTLYYPVLLKYLQLDMPESNLFIQMSGLTLALLGAGLIAAARNPLENRGLLALALAVQSIVVVLISFKIFRGRLPASIFPFLLFGMVIFLPALAIILRRLNSLAQLASQSANASSGNAFQASWRKSIEHRPHWLGGILRGAWFVLGIGVFVTTLLATAHALGALGKQLFGPPPLVPLVLTGIHTNLPTNVGPITPLACENAFPNLRFTDPTFITPLPDGSGRLLVVERVGRIQHFNNQWNAHAKTCFLDISARTMQLPDGAEDGLFGVAFHPQFATVNSPHRGEFFVHYTAKVNGQRYNRLSKFQVPAGSDVAAADSETVLIDTVDLRQSHNGGSVLFGPDGFLYLTLGDDGEPHPNRHAQHIDGDLFSGILRIDVDCRGGEISHAPPRQPDNGKTAHYFIPNDNPFVGIPKALEEFYAIGLRNPWRATFDDRTGNLWVADVGDRRREEINIVPKGANCGWAYAEGTMLTKTYNARALDRPEKYLGVETWPVWEYSHDALNRCVIGGYVYHGSQFPELADKYVYADQSGRIYALEIDEHNHAVSNSLVAVVDDPGLGVSSFGQNADGELFICVIRDLREHTGEVQHLVRPERVAAEHLPERLSETNVFADLKSLKPAAGFVPYQIISPSWSDRAAKQRWIGLPQGQTISGDLNGPWQFPIGTVFIKHFDLPLDARDPANPTTMRRLETRLLVRSDDGVYAATYRWNKDSTDAQLVNESASEDIEYTDVVGNRHTQTWTYPGRFECLACHNSQANYVLGFSAKQLNRDISVDGHLGNQLQCFSDSNMFLLPCTQMQLQSAPKLVALDDASATRADRVRSYLDANCAQCHRPGHFFGAWDARFETPLESQGIVSGRTFMHHNDAADAQVVRPGDPENSFLLKRISSTEPFMKMPPLGRNVVDEQFTTILTDWIKSMLRAKPKSIDGKEAVDF